MEGGPFEAALQPGVASSSNLRVRAATLLKEP